MNKVLLCDIESKYGADSKEFAALFSVDGESIDNIFYYSAFAKMFSLYILKCHENNRYSEFVSEFNKEIKDLFPVQRDVMRNIYMNSPVGILAFGRQEVTNLIERKFKRKDGRTAFASEHDMEMVLYDYIHWFDLGETVSVKRQFEKVDLMVSHKDKTYAIELKKGISKRKDVYQSLDYSKLIPNSTPILISHGFPEDHIELAKELGVSLYEYKVYNDLPYTCVSLIPIGGGNKDFTGLIEWMEIETCEISSYIPKTMLDKSINEIYTNCFNEANKFVQSYNNGVQEIRNRAKGA